MKSINFSDGLEEYRLNDRVTVRFNPTDVGFLEKLSHTFEQLDQLQDELQQREKRIEKYVKKYEIPLEKN